MISNETIKNFQKVAEKEFGVLLDDKESQKILSDLVGYFDLLAKIDHRKKSNQDIYGEERK